MKVDQVHDLSHSLPQRVNNAKEPDGPEFKTILEQKMDPRPLQDIDNTPAPAAPEMIPDVAFRPLAAVEGHGIIDEVEGFLDTLETYQQQLADAGVNLKELSPLVDRIRAQGEQLSSYLEGLRPEDGMQDILSQMLITSSLEVIRFNRGDYVG